MPDLLELPPKAVGGKGFADGVIPLPLTWEERKCSFICPLLKYNISVFTCWQCEHWEVHSELTNEVTKTSGHCVWPKKASKESRKQTSLVALKISMKAEATDSVEDRSARRSSKKKKAGGAADKKEFCLEYLQATPSKSGLFAALLETFGQLSDMYMNTLYYAARKEIEGYVEEDTPKQKSPPKRMTKEEKQRAVLANKAAKQLKEDARREKLRAKRGERKKDGVPAHVKKDFALKLLQKRGGCSKQDFEEAMFKKFQMSKAYISVIYYQVKKLAK